ncbi:ribosome biogenesis GTPase Lsg1, putative [Talaromyces stipitatus ATCC 10500]|uniref:Ribosome biogenesis GTPase Lsg1, putative n=1 Tax=Talaromyces stipitatus (strain ATCC 10500 / CBS 375.48 / QM 6759 / NRRL 1006) TaxID=441959 RepID=B8MBQ7_TALSN|nr:ribosome biogenesis GTPase Lsg1, putative [Talaromyces stipitatus ATCC 10500]EED18190.1 ribosome biogenesis GTPase Lsg1, putative [Talaromyces stipitatus ATCC 10500]
MVLAKSKNTVGLGNSLMNDRFGRGKASSQKKVSHNASIARKNQSGETYITNAAKEASWVKMRSITEQAALDEFLSTAELADTDFTAEKINNVKIIHADQKNPFLLSAAEERFAVRKQQKNKERLTIPRRPKWDSTTTPEKLDAMERESLLEWRRGLAELQESNDLLMTPFERNVEVWRQLWRVIERSDLVVQIVDARNPLLFRSEDLEKYVKEIDSKKRNLLLVNKADMLTPEQRALWADYFEEHGISYRFFSAHLAKERNEARLLEEDSSSGEDVDDAEDLAAETQRKMNLREKQLVDEEWSSEEDIDDEAQKDLQSEKTESDLRTRILDVEELEELFLANAPQPEEGSDNPQKDKTIIGLVGYPNVGKSSTINALLGAKKVSVSATPGKTKHFQTLYLSPNLLLCDCPGLVFPNFASTKAELVVNGVLPIDQLREFTGPAGLVAHRIPKHFLEAVYGMKIYTRPIEEGGTGIPNANELLRAYARARGFATQGLGQPDESRAARYILKDYVNGKLLYCHPPPASKTDEEDSEGGPVIDPAEFNRDLYNLAHLPEKRRAQLLKAAAATGENVDILDDAASLVSEFTGGATSQTSSAATPVENGPRSRRLDKGFFGPGSGGSRGHQTMPFNYKYSEQGKAKQLTGRKERAMIALEKNIDPSEVKGLIGSSKKHFKGGKRTHNKSGKGKAPLGVGADDYDGY